MAITDSILDTVKKMLSIDPSNTTFDIDITIHINSVFAALNQMGVGPTTIFSIEDNTSNWSDFINGQELVNSVRTYMYLKVKMVFDPPATSFALDAYQKQIDEYEWRMNFAMENYNHPAVVPTTPQLPEWLIDVQPLAYYPRAEEQRDEQQEAEQS